MKVVCIDSTALPQDPQCPLIVKDGDILEVADVVDDIFNRGKLYVFVDCPDWGFWVEFFIPISDIDETEMNREYLSTPKIRELIL